jgi:hypothetical protein
MFPTHLNQQLMIDRRVRLEGEADALRQIRGIGRTRRGRRFRLR